MHSNPGPNLYPRIVGGRETLVRQASGFWLWLQAALLRQPVARDLFVQWTWITSVCCRCLLFDLEVVIAFGASHIWRVRAFCYMGMRAANAVCSRYDFVGRLLKTCGQKELITALRMENGQDRSAELTILSPEFERKCSVDTVKQNRIFECWTFAIVSSCLRN
jgi:hypothetical protein